MVWNKTPEEIVSKVVQSLLNIETDYKDIAEQFGVSYWLVGEIAKKNLPKEIIKQRYSFRCRRGKIGNKNHMYGKKGILHHNAKEVVLVKGYPTVWKPEWFTGKSVKENRIFEHVYIWCLNYNHTEVPKNCVIHHIDHTKTNNEITNLQLLTISEHMEIHGRTRKVQRLSRKGVENSILETQSIPCG